MIRKERVTDGLESLSLWAQSRLTHVIAEPHLFLAKLVFWISSRNGPNGVSPGNVHTLSTNQQPLFVESVIKAEVKCQNTTNNKTALVGEIMNVTICYSWGRKKYTNARFYTLGTLRVS